MGGTVPFIAFYPSDWRGGVVDLTDFEELVYLKICLAIWDRGKPVHEDDVLRLFRREPSGVEEAIGSLIRLEKLTRDEAGFLMNARALTAYRDARKRVKAAKKGAASRWAQKRKRENAAAKRQQSEGTATAMPAQCQPESDPEPEKEMTPSRESSRARATPGSRLPPDWMPCDAAIAFAQENGMTNGEIGHTSDRFRDYWIAQPGQRGVKRDWLATWRNWVRREIADQGARPSHRNGQSERRTQRAIKTDLAGALARGVAERRQSPPRPDRGQPGGVKPLAPPATSDREPVG